MYGYEPAGGGRGKVFSQEEYERERYAVPAAR
jgi:hypothetical protein